MENFGVCYGHLEYLTAIWNSLWPFRTFCGHLIYFFAFWFFVPRKIWQPCLKLSNEVTLLYDICRMHWHAFKSATTVNNQNIVLLKVAFFFHFY
jgi:hypothetical protein